MCDDYKRAGLCAFVYACAAHRLDTIIFKQLASGTKTCGYTTNQLLTVID